MSFKIKIALLQLLPAGTREKQLEKGIKACRDAKEMGADIALFPEMWSSGYVIPPDDAERQKEAVPADGEFVGAFGSLAEKLDMAIGITFLEKTDGRPRNSLVLFDRHGEAVLHYAKVHTCGFEAERLLDGGGGFVVAELDTAQGAVRVGSMICYDREFPESARVLMQMGAELILAPNACPMEINRLSALRTRAYENMLAVATCNYPAGQPDCNGHSSVFDGVAWMRDEPGVCDMCVLEAPESEGVYIAEVDIERLRRYRANEVMGDAFRHPDKYGILTEDRRYIETERLFLVPMRLRFLHSTHEYASDPENTRFMVSLPNDTLDDTRQFIINAENEWRKPEPGYYEYAIIMDGAHVGAISLYPDDNEPNTMELGWTVNKRYQNRGICFEAAKALVEYAQENLGTKRFIAHCDSENAPSYRVMEKLGMKRISEHGGRFNKLAPDEERREYMYELFV